MIFGAGVAFEMWRDVDEYSLAAKYLEKQRPFGAREYFPPSRLNFGRDPKVSGPREDQERLLRFPCNK